MTRIAVFGATGYAGGAVVREARSRSHEVVAVARRVEGLQAEDGLTVRAGDVFDEAFTDDLIADVDAAVVALHVATSRSGRRLIDAVPALLRATAASGGRIGLVGGAGSLLVAPEGPRLMDVVEPPAALKDEVESAAELLDRLRADDSGADWFSVSPGARFGSHNPGVRTGVFRIGGDVLLRDDAGESFISAEDLAIAVVDEIETPRHHRARFHAAY